MKYKHIIIIPVYNELAVLKITLPAYIKNTDLRECTTYIVDDGSDLPTKKYLDKIIKANSRIILHSNKKNIGKPKSINSIMHKNKNADFFTIIDSDLKIISKNWQKTLLSAHKIWGNQAILGGLTHQQGFEFKKGNLTFGDTFPFWTLAGGFFSIPKFVFKKLGYF